MHRENNPNSNPWRGGLTPLDVDRIHEHSLEILGTIGVRLASSEARSILVRAGAMIDESRGVVLLPREVVEEALGKAPSELERWSVDGQRYNLANGGMYQCTGTHRTKYLDYRAERSRRATRRDLEALVRVADGLPGIISVSPMVTPCDGDEGPVELMELETLLLNTGKHIFNSPSTVEETRRTLDLAEAVSSESLLRRPAVTIRAGCHSPLVLSDDVAGVVVESARRGAILALGSGCVAGTSAPVTLAGTILLSNTEFLFLLTLAQLARPGAPLDYQVSDTIADLRTGLIMFGAVEMTLITAGMMAMAERYHLPFSANQSTDTPVIEVDTGVQKMLHFGYKMAMGVNFLRNAGDLAKASTMSCEQVVIDHEIGQVLQRFWSGIRVDEDTLALEAIRAVGPGGTFITHDHTLAHCRSGEHYLAPLLYRGDTGRPTMLEWAHNRVEELLQNHSYRLADEKVELLDLYVRSERGNTRA